MKPILAFCLQFQKTLGDYGAQLYLIAPEIYKENYEIAIQDSHSKLLFCGLSGNPKETMQGTFK